MFWFKDRHMPYHFAICAEIHGKATLTSWVKAVDAMQRRHPAFSVHIAQDENGAPCFCQCAVHKPIPLRIVAQDGTTWEDEMQRELTIPFNAEEAPLVRAALLLQPHRTFLILAAHHSIADTKSLVFAIRDMLRVLAGHALEPLLPVGPLDSLLQPFRVRSGETGLAGASFPSPGSLDVYRSNNGSPPSVKALKLSRDFTSELRRRSGMEGTTVHGALVAAGVEAARLTSPELKAATINIGSAIDSRDSVAGGEGVALLSAGGSILVHPEKRDFWELARFARRCIVPIKAPEVMTTLMDGLTDYLATPRTENDIAALMAGLRFDINISNLGSLSIETCFGNLSLAQLWGPALLAGFKGEQEIGVATINGSLSLLHVSHSPLPLFLQVMRDRLVAACSYEGAVAGPKH
jgi:Condensation domain